MASRPPARVNWGPVDSDDKDSTVVAAAPKPIESLFRSGEPASAVTSPAPAVADGVAAIDEPEDDLSGLFGDDAPEQPSETVVSNVADDSHNTVVARNDPDHDPDPDRDSDSLADMFADIATDGIDTAADVAAPPAPEKGELDTEKTSQPATRAGNSASSSTAAPRRPSGQGRRGVGTVGGKGSRTRVRGSGAASTKTPAQRPTTSGKVVATEEVLAEVLGWGEPAGAAPKVQPEGDPGVALALVSESPVQVSDASALGELDGAPPSSEIAKWSAPGYVVVTDVEESRLPEATSTDHSVTSNLPALFEAPGVPTPVGEAAPATLDDTDQRDLDYDPPVNGPDTAEQRAQRAAFEETARRQAGQLVLQDAASKMLALAGADPTVTVELRKMQLTRNLLEDSTQRQNFQTLLEPTLAKAQMAYNDPRDIGVLFDLAYDQMLGLGPLGPLWRDDSVTEIMINSFDEIFVEVGGRILDTPFKLRGREALMKMARDLAGKVSSRVLSAENSLVTAELPGARVNFAYDTVTKSGAVITIRKFTKLFGIEKLLEFGSLNEEMLEFLRDCVHARANILISGGTGSGKTTVINAMSSFIPSNERVITIEDAFELKLSNHHVVALQTKEKASGDDRIVITQSELMTNALRMRPDRIIIGEVRDDDAALVLMDAANTGHDGTMTTIHANNAYLALNDRLVVMMRSGRNIPDEVARRSVASAINLVIQVRKTRGRRIISEIAVVDSTYVVDGLITPVTIFSGHLDAEGAPVYSRIHGLGAETDLAQRFESAELDITRWRQS